MFVLGVFVGVILGIFVMCICIAAKNSDKMAEKLFKERVEKLNQRR